MVRGSVPLPTNVNPLRCVDFVAVDSFCVGLICKPSRKMVEGGVADARVSHSCRLAAEVPVTEARMGIVEPCCG